MREKALILLRGKAVYNGSEHPPEMDLLLGRQIKAGKHLLQAAHIGGKVLHLAQALVHLFQLVVHSLEALGHPFLQGILQLLVHGVADLIQLFGVLGLQGGHVFRKGLAQLFQLLGVGGLQTLEPLGQDLLLAALALLTVCAWLGNIGKNKADVLKDEMRRLCAAKGKSLIVTMLDEGKGPIDPKPMKINSVMSERQLVEQNGLHYYRIAATDHIWPSPENIDDFISFIGTLPDHAWLHFHCRAGKGRTTIYMAMYDMMKNPFWPKGLRVPCWI